MIEKINAMGREITLPSALTEEEVNDRPTFLSLLRDIAPEVAEDIDGREVTIKIEGSVAIIYRDSAVMG